MALQGALPAEVWPSTAPCGEGWTQAPEECRADPPYRCPERWLSGRPRDPGFNRSKSWDLNPWEVPCAPQTSPGPDRAVPGPRCVHAAELPLTSRQASPPPQPSLLPTWQDALPWWSPGPPCSSPANPLDPTCGAADHRPANRPPARCCRPALLGPTSLPLRGLALLPPPRSGRYQTTADLVCILPGSTGLSWPLSSFPEAHLICLG